MKKMMILAGVWFACLVSFTLCKGVSNIEYTIYFDTNSHNTYEVKEEIQSIYTRLVSGIHKESYIMMVLNNLDQFAYDKQMEARWEHNQLNIIVGDGKGVEIHGELQSISMCVYDVEPRSFLKDFFFPS